MTNREYMEELGTKIVNVLAKNVWVVLWIVVLGGIAIILGSALLESMLAVLMLPYGVFSTIALYVLFDKWLDLPRGNKEIEK